MADIAGFFKRFWVVRDELTVRNVRWPLWVMLLMFPLATIIGDLRYLDQDRQLFGLESTTLIFMAYGLGWLVTVFISRRHILTALRAAVLIQALLLVVMLIAHKSLALLLVYLCFHVANGVCLACAFWHFSFRFNNVERLLAMLLMQLYYAVIALFWHFSVVSTFLKTYGSAAVMLALLVVCFLYRPQNNLEESDHTSTADSHLAQRGTDSGVPAALGAGAIYYLLMLMLTWIEYDEARVLSFMFGIGAVAAIVVFIALQLYLNKSALHLWNLMLVLVLAGAAALLPNNTAAINAGSFLWGTADGLGYVVTFYMLGCALKRSQSHRMFRITCIVLFVEYTLFTGIFDFAYERFDLPNHYLAFAVVLIICLLALLLAPLLQHKLFEADWTDGLRGTDALPILPPNQFDAYGLTPRETQVFTLLLTNITPRQIAAELGISYASVNFHTTNLYRKLHVQSRTELFMLTPPTPK